jgi:hypothetical protein
MVIDPIGPRFPSHRNFSKKMFQSVLIQTPEFMVRSGKLDQED